MEVGGFRCRACRQWIGDTLYQISSTLHTQYDHVCYDCVGPPADWDRDFDRAEEYVAMRAQLSALLAGVWTPPTLTAVSLITFISFGRTHRDAAAHFGVPRGVIHYAWVKVRNHAKSL